MYVDPDGVECRVAWDRLARVTLEWGRPVRRFPVVIDSRPVELMAGALVGDPIAVLPVLYHLLWCGDLVADLSLVLTDRTAVRTRALAAVWGGRG